MAGKTSVFDNGGYIGRKATFGERISTSVVTSGLVLYLDAGNTASYPGTGTTWTDLSGSANNSTLTNGPTFGSGAFTFDGTDDYGTLTPAKLPTGTTDRTIMAFVKTPTSWSEVLLHVIHWGNTAQDQAFGLAVDNTGKLNTHPWVGYPTQGTVAVNTNYCLAVSYGNTGTLHKFWINGVSQGAGVSRAINTGTGDARIGSRITGAEDWGPGGVIHVILVYNRVLTDAEITLNFNAFRSRQGL